MVVGMALITGGMLWYTQIPVHGSYASDLLPGYLMVGVGMAFAFIPVSIAALAGVEAREAGLASGLLNTSQQIGGAIGVAVAATVATTHATTLLTSGHSFKEAYTSGFSLAFWVIAGVAAVGVFAALALVRRDEVPAGAEAGGTHEAGGTQVPPIGFPAMARMYPTVLELVGGSPIVR